MPSDKLLAGIERFISPKLNEILEKRIPVIEKIAALEHVIADLEKRLSVS